MFQYISEDIGLYSISDSAGIRTVTARASTATADEIIDGLMYSIYLKIPFADSGGTRFVYPATDSGWIEVEAYGTDIIGAATPTQPFFKKRIDFQSQGGFVGTTFKKDSFDYQVQNEVINSVAATGKPIEELVYRQRFTPVFYTDDDMYYAETPSLPLNSVTYSGFDAKAQTQNVYWRMGIYPCLIRKNSFSLKYRYPLRNYGKGTFPGGVGLNPLTFFLLRQEHEKVAKTSIAGPAIVGDVRTAFDVPYRFFGGFVIDNPNMSQIASVQVQNGGWLLFYKDAADGQIKSLYCLSAMPRLAGEFSTGMTLFTNPDIRFFSVIQLRNGQMAAAAVSLKFPSGIVELIFKRPNESGEWPADADAVSINITTYTVTKSSISLVELADGTLIIYAVRAYWVSADGGVTWEKKS